MAEISAPAKMLEIYPDTVEAVRKEINLDKPGRVDEALDLLENWVKTQQHFTKKTFPRIYLETTLVSAKGSVERAKEKLDKLCTVKTLMPEFFPNTMTKDIVIEYKELLKDIVIQVNLPKLTKEHNRIYLLKLLSDNFDSFIILTYVKYLMLICEHVKRNDYNAGLVLILDYRDMSVLNIASNLSIMNLKRIFTLVTEGYGFRLKGIHIISNSKVVEPLISLFKTVLSTKLGSRLHLHKNLDTLYDFVDKDALPEDYGGKEIPFQDLEDKYFDVLCSENHLEFIREIYEAKTDESRRDTSVFNEHYLGIPGTFRTLSVD